MKIVIIGAMLNEEHVIGNFLTHYGSFADEIILGDGGSTDRTVEIAGRFDNVRILDTSHLQVPAPESPYGFHVPEAPQFNVLATAATEAGADWIIEDDIDCWPNSHLRQNARALLAGTDQESVYLYRLYIYGQDRYFPKMNEPGHSFWAWQPGRVTVKADVSDPNAAGLRDLPTDRRTLDPPYACLHYFCPNEEIIKRKVGIKRARGKAWVHPLKSQYAPAVPLPGWAL